MTCRTKFTPERVTRLYNGKANACCCGCKGKYVQRSDPSFAGALKRFQTKLETALVSDGAAGRVDAEDNYVAVETETRVTIAYFD